MHRSFGRIQFSPGSLIYLMVTALITFAAFYTQANLLFWTLGLVVGALGTSILVALFTLNNLEIKRLAPTRGVAGEPLILRHHLFNHSKLPCFSVEIIETWSNPKQADPTHQNPLKASPPKLKGRPFGWVLHLGQGQSIQAEAPCWPTRRGVLRFEKIIVRSGFPFGILRKAVQFPQPGEVLIYPPLRRLNRQAALSLSSTDVNNAKHADRGGGMDEFFGLRPYRPGDNYKLIDWKHSARTNNLVSREMAKPRPPRMMILLDLSTTHPQKPDPQNDHAWIDAQEEAINLAGSLIREAYLHSIHVGLATKGVQATPVPMNHNQTHRQKLLDSLASLDLNKRTDAAETQPLLPAQPTVIVRANHPSDTHENPTEKASILNVSHNGRRMPRQPQTNDWHAHPEPQPLNT